MSAGGGATRATAAESAERERFPRRQESVSLRHRRSEPTWGNGVEHSGSRWFADTEEVTGSNPVAPTTKPLTSENAVTFTTMALSRQKRWVGYLFGGSYEGCVPDGERFPCLTSLFMDSLGPDPLRSGRCPALMPPAARGEPHLSQSCYLFAGVADRRWQPVLARRG
jgi:hypothetical protein